MTATLYLITFPKVNCIVYSIALYIAYYIELHCFVSALDIASRCKLYCIAFQTLLYCIFCLHCMLKWIALQSCIVLHCIMYVPSHCIAYLIALDCISNWNVLFRMSTSVSWSSAWTSLVNWWTCVVGRRKWRPCWARAARKRGAETLWPGSRWPWNTRKRRLYWYGYTFEIVKRLQYNYYGFMP